MSNSRLKKIFAGAVIGGIAGGPLPILGNVSGAIVGGVIAAVVTKPPKQ
jgi:hypothetical protein